MTKNYSVISCDGHLEIPPDGWMGHVPPEHRERAPRLVRLAGGGELKQFLLLARELRMPALSAKGSFAGALGVRLGGPTQYAHELEIRPTLGDGPAPRIVDLKRAVQLSRVVQFASAVLATVAVSVACRSGRRASLRWSKAR